MKRSIFSVLIIMGLILSFGSFAMAQDSIDTLISKLGNENQRARFQIASQLAKQKEAAEGKVLKALAGKDDAIRVGAAETLAFMQSEKGLEEVFKAVQKEKDNDLKMKFATAYCYFNKYDKLVELIKANDSTAKYILPVLLDISVNYIRGKESGSEIRVLYSQVTIDNFAKLSELAIPWITDQLKKAEDDLTKAKLILALGYTKSKNAVKSILPFASDDKAELRSFAARALGSNGNEECRDSLMKLAKDKNDYVKMVAVQSLGALPKDIPVEMIIEIASGEGRMSSSAAIATLQKIAGDVEFPNLKDVKDKKGTLNDWWKNNNITATTAPIEVIVGEAVPKNK